MWVPSLTTLLLLLLSSYVVNTNAQGDDDDDSTEWKLTVALVAISVLALGAIIGLIVFGVCWKKRMGGLNKDGGTTSPHQRVSRKIMYKQMTTDEAPQFASSGKRNKDAAYAIINGE